MRVDGERRGVRAQERVAVGRFALELAVGDAPGSAGAVVHDEGAAFATPGVGEVARGGVQRAAGGVAHQQLAGGVGQQRPGRTRGRQGREQLREGATGECVHAGPLLSTATDVR